MIDKQPLIFSALQEVKKRLPAVGKDQKNEAQRYNFRGIEPIVNVIAPLFAEFGIATVPEVLSFQRDERETRNGGVMTSVTALIKTTYYALDGSSISTVTLGEGMDSGDKASNKAMTAAYKYSLAEALTIPFAALDDGDSDSPEQVPKHTPEALDGVDREIAEQTYNWLVNTWIKDKKNGMDRDQWQRTYKDKVNALPKDLVKKFREWWAADGKDIRPISRNNGEHRVNPPADYRGGREDSPL